MPPPTPRRTHLHKSKRIPRVSNAIEAPAPVNHARAALPETYFTTMKLILWSVRFTTRLRPAETTTQRGTAIVIYHPRAQITLNKYLSAHTHMSILIASRSTRLVLAACVPCARRERDTHFSRPRDGLCVYYAVYLPKTGQIILSAAHSSPWRRCVRAPKGRRVDCWKMTPHIFLILFLLVVRVNEIQ